MEKEITPATTIATLAEMGLTVKVVDPLNRSKDFRTVDGRLESQWGFVYIEAENDNHKSE